MLCRILWLRALKMATGKTSFADKFLFVQLLRKSKAGLSVSFDKRKQTFQ